MMIKKKTWHMVTLFYSYKVLINHKELTQLKQKRNTTVNKCYKLCAPGLLGEQSIRIVIFFPRGLCIVTSAPFQMKALLGTTEERGIARNSQYKNTVFFKASKVTKRLGKN